MNNLSLLLSAGGFSLLATFAVTLLVIKLSKSRKSAGRLADLHHHNGKNISRLGGIGMAVALLVSAVIYLCGPFTADDKMTCRLVVTLTLAMFTLGLWDDLRALGAKRKLLGQILIASAAFWGGISIENLTIPFAHQGVVCLGLWAWPVTVLWLVAITNLINLIDGVDGLAGGICLMLMILLAIVGGGLNCVSYLASGLIGALLGFLWFNFPPAKIYMGDGGAYSLGFLIACLTIVSSQKGTIIAALIAPLFALALPILDTSIAILRRGLNGLPLFRADRRHIHHRLLSEGISRRRLVLGSYMFTAFFLFLGLAAFWSHGAQLPILFGFGLLFILIAAGQMQFSREWFSVGRVLITTFSRRAEIQYALAHNRWLMLEGSRCNNLDSLFEDTAFVACKLGFTGLKIRLSDTEKNWCQPGSDSHHCVLFPQNLPGQECYLEFSALPSVQRPNKHPQLDERTFRILAELVTEGWVKAMTAWAEHSGQPPRFSKTQS